MLLPHILIEQSETRFKQHLETHGASKGMKNSGTKICQWSIDSIIYLASFVLFAFKFWLKGIFKLYNAFIGPSTSHYIYYLEVNQYNLTIGQQIAFSNW